MAAHDLRHRHRSTAGYLRPKWDRYPQGVLPMWVADMDFPVAEPIAAALRNRLDHPVFGYGGPGPASLRDAIASDMLDLYGWSISPADVVFFCPASCPASTRRSRPSPNRVTGWWWKKPVYPANPRRSPANWDLTRGRRPAAVGRTRFGGRSRPFEPAPLRTRRLSCSAIRTTPAAGQEHGRNSKPSPKACLASGSVIISDEIHCDIVYGGARHVPIASLSPEVAARTITLMAASKTYNIAGLKTAYAIITDAELRRRFAAASLGMSEGANVLGLVATEAASSAMVARGSRRSSPILKPTATIWSPASSERFRKSASMHRKRPILPGSIAQRSTLAMPTVFFLDKAKVAFNPGPSFGGDDHHVRLNFGCPPFAPR